jgi:hypothetical protein
LPDAKIEIAQSRWGNPNIERSAFSIRDAVGQIAYEFLEETHFGWENNDGAYGEFTFDVAERAITLDYNQRFSDAVYSQHVFWGDAMGHCYHHALSSVKKWGGMADEFLPLHQWFDESKAITADFRHRALRHHAEGIFTLERFFGPTIPLSTGRVVAVRLIGEQHVREDLGFIPSFADWVRCIRPQVWMGRAQPIHRDVDPFVSGMPSEPDEG